MIQRKIRDCLVIKYSKIEVLISFWNKLLGKIYQNANDPKQHDKKTLKVL